MICFRIGKAIAAKIMFTGNVFPNPVKCEILILHRSYRELIRVCGWPLKLTALTNVLCVPGVLHFIGYKNTA